jgi:acylphosphatase
MVRQGQNMGQSLAGRAPGYVHLIDACSVQRYNREQMESRRRIVSKVMNDKDLAGNSRATLRASAHGYVQGVGFRVFIRSQAWDLGVRGYVQNLRDGTVKVVASGPRKSLETLLQELWRGPAGAHVTAVDTEWSDSEDRGLPTHFEVRH